MQAETGMPSQMPPLIVPLLEIEKEKTGLLQVCSVEQSRYIDVSYYTRDFFRANEKVREFPPLPPHFSVRCFHTCISSYIFSMASNASLPS